MTNDILKGIGKRLSQARKAKNYTQEQLANQAGLSVKMISAAENGYKAMRPENIIKICECLSISTDYLLCGKSDVLSAATGYSKLEKLSLKQKEALSKIIEDFLSAFDEEKSP